MKLWLIVIVFLFHSSTAEDTTLNCHFLVPPERAYTCVVERYGPFASASVRVVNASGGHMTGYSDDDVTGVAFYFVSMDFFPKDLARTFKNIESITVESSGLKKITLRDLENFPNLKNLYLNQNQIEVIGAETFKHNPKLERIVLELNPLKHIDATVFSNLEYLTSLRLGSCDGAGDYENAYDREQVLRVIAKVEEGECRNDELTYEKSETEIVRLAPEDSSTMMFLLLAAMVLVIAVLVILVVKRKFF